MTRQAGPSRDQALTAYSRVLRQCDALVDALREQALLALEGPALPGTDREYLARLDRGEQRIEGLREEYASALQRSVATHW